MRKQGFDCEKYVELQTRHIRERIDQFGGKLKGWLGFFDAAIIEPKPFESVDDVLRINIASLYSTSTVTPPSASINFLNEAKSTAIYSSISILKFFSIVSIKVAGPPRL